MVHGKNRIPYWIDWRLPGLAGPEYDATISSRLASEPEDSQYGEYRSGWFSISKTIIPDAQEHFLTHSTRRDTHLFGGFGLLDRPAIDWPCRT